MIFSRDPVVRRIWRKQFGAIVGPAMTAILTLMMHGDIALHFFAFIGLSIVSLDSVNIALDAHRAHYAEKLRELRLATWYPLLHDGLTRKSPRPNAPEFA